MIEKMIASFAFRPLHILLKMISHTEAFLTSLQQTVDEDRQQAPRSCRDMLKNLITRTATVTLHRGRILITTTTMIKPTTISIKTTSNLRMVEMAIMMNREQSTREFYNSYSLAAGVTTMPTPITLTIKMEAIMRVISKVIRMSTITNSTTIKVPLLRASNLIMAKVATRKSDILLKRKWAKNRTDRKASVADTIRKRTRRPLAISL